MKLTYDRRLSTAFVVVVCCSGWNLLSNSASAQGSYAQTIAVEFNPTSSAYQRSPLSGFRPFVLNASGNETTTSIANAATIGADALALAYGQKSADGIIKKVEIERKNYTAGSNFANAWAVVDGTQFQVQGNACNDFNVDGQCDVKVQIVIPAATLDLPQHLVADDPFGFLVVEGCEFASDQAACEQNGVAQAFDTSVRYSASVDIPSEGISESIFGQVTLSGTGGFTYEAGENIFQQTNAFGDPVTDQFGRTTATVASQVVIREYLIDTDNETFLSPLIIIDQTLAMNGPPLPGIPAADWLPDQPITDFFDPDAIGDIPYYRVIRNEEGGRGAFGDFALNVNVDGGTIVLDDFLPATIYSVSSELLTSFNRGAVNLVNGSGLNPDGSHSIVPDGNMWLNAGNGCCGDAADSLQPGAEVAFDLGSVFSLDRVKIWNYNETLPNRDELLGRGARLMDISISNDGVSFALLLEDVTLEIAPGEENVDFGQLIDLHGAEAQYVKLSIKDNFEIGDNDFIGLSEVQFFQVPEPASGLLLIVGVMAIVRLRQER